MSLFSVVCVFHSIITKKSRLDFDMWAKMGNEGWSYKEVLPYFIKSENCTGCVDIDDGFHGMDGYVNIEHPGYESPMVKQFLKAGLDLGYKINDPNGKVSLGKFIHNNIAVEV